MQYLLSNKVSHEELQRLMQNKSNTHEINTQLTQLDSKVEEIYREMQSKMATFALQKDFGYLTTILESKANIDDVNESLS
jgi:predicted transcriptional regulator